ncbi:MAG: choice-of-anchor Q domain-containing protein [Planctomycetota bacterium]
MFTFNCTTAAPNSTIRGAALLIADSTGVSISGSTFHANTVRRTTGTAAFGGAVAVNGTSTTDVLFENSTFFANEADTSGGALYLSNPSAAVTLNHVTVADNVAYTAAGAAAIHRAAAASLAIRNSIVAINNNIRQVSLRSVVADQLIVGNATITNSLVWFPPRSLSGLPIDAAQRDPVLAPLQDAGGRTLVMPPSNFLAGFGFRTYQQGTTTVIMSTSPAIDKVPPGSSGTTVDQRGVTRSFGNADIGAVEVQAIQSRALQVNRLTSTAGQLLIGWSTLNGADIIQADRGAPAPGATAAVDIMLTPLDAVANVTGDTWKSLLVDSRPVQLVGTPPTAAGQKLRIRHFLSTPIDRSRSDLEMRLQGLPAGRYRVEILGLNADRAVSGMSYAVGVVGTFNALPAGPSGSRLLDDLFSGQGGNVTG